MPADLQAFVTSLAIGLLIGLERERKPDAKAGLRTFGLTALLGCLSALIARETGNGWILALGLLTVGAMMMAAIAMDPPDDGDPGTTSVVALMLAYGLGAAVWLGHGPLAVMLAIAATSLLYFKSQLHGFTVSLSNKDVLSVLQFAVLSFIVLPILPDQNYGPYQAFNPHQIWRMVVLISGVSLAGYAALRLVGVQHGAAVIGFFGGLVSSTATTMVFARHARNESGLIPTAALVILLANLVVLLRIGLVAAFLAPELIPDLAPLLGCGFVFGLGVALWGWKRHGEHQDLPMPEVRNPTELRTALTFGLLYGAVLLVSAWLQDLAGSKGMYLVSLASGLTDVDAITLSTLHLLEMGKVPTVTAVTAITLAVLSNLAFKASLAISIGGKTLAWRVVPGIIAIALGLSLGLVLV
ncbi:MgtC/SapB family protein [Denitratisoma sp. agr-D3]